VVAQRSRCPRGTPGRAAVAAALAVLLLIAPAFMPAEEVLRHDNTRVNQAPSIQLAADEIATWTDGGVRVFLLRGNVRVSQGDTRARMQQAVAWVDEAGQNRTGVYTVDVYGEANFELQTGGASRTAGQGVVQLATRGQVDIKAEKVQRTAPQLTDLVFQKAMASRRAPVPVVAPPVAATIIQAGGPAATTSLPPTPASTISARMGPNDNPPPIAPIAPVNLVPIQQVQFTPAPAPSAPQPSAPQPSAPLPSTGVQPSPVPVIPGAQAAPAPPQPPTIGPIGPIGGAKGAPAPLPGPGGGSATPRNLTIWPRSSIRGEVQSYPLPNDETAWVYTGGIILRVSNPGTKKGVLDIEGDRVVVWSKDKKKDTGEHLSTPEGETTNQIEFYIAGHVELRYESNKGETEKLTADEVYYDVSRNVAIALQGELEIRDPKLPYPLHMKAPELHQLNAKTFETKQSEVFSTILPSDPGLEIQIRKSRVVEVQEIRKDIFGREHVDPKTGEPLVTNERYFTGRDMVVYLEGLPIFYWPYYTANVEEPLGPLKAISFNYNKIFGFQLFTTWDMFSILGMRRPEGSAWRLYLDYLTARGPAIGTEYDWSGRSFFGLSGKFDNVSKLYYIHDTGQDTVGSGGQFSYITPQMLAPIVHPDNRGRIFERFNAQEMHDGFSFQGQVSLLSDRNFMEQFYQWEYLNDLNQETFAYLKQQQNNWAWTLLVQPRVIDWVTTTETYPGANGYLLGETLFDRFIYNARASAGYYKLRVTDQAEYAFEPTDKGVSTARVDLWQELSFPFQLGAFKLVPYVVGDATYYSDDINGSQVGRLFGGGGLRASVPFSKLYPEVQSELFNLNGIFHKIVFSGNYFNAGSTIPHTQLPQLDRLNDDVTDFTLRNMHVQNPNLIPNNGLLLSYSPIYDPQNYAIRRLLDTRIDTLDSVESLTFDIRQRLQTKRGFPGAEHIVDWMTLDVSATLFPDTHRDNFGNLVGFIDYDWNWNIGDRTALFSAGWFEPFENGAKVWSVGATFNRPDTTNLLISYRQLDPVGSKAVIAQLTFPFSAKYALTAGTTWDFGAKNQVYTLLLTRKGTDVLIGFGISYNSILNNFGFTFEVVPNLLLSRLRPGVPGSTGSVLQGTNSAMTGSGR
jgi:hypothetical protein